MTNEKKYPTQESRLIGFDYFCRSHRTCCDCQIFRGENQIEKDCALHWLALDDDKVAKPMANTTQQLTVADLEAAKERHERMANINAPHNELFIIAATCIGIVEEMVKLDSIKSNTEWHRYVHDDSPASKQGGMVADKQVLLGQFSRAEYAVHCATLHNLWLKAVAAFGGEVK